MLSKKSLRKKRDIRRLLTFDKRNEKKDIRRLLALVKETKRDIRRLPVSG